MKDIEKLNGFVGVVDVYTISNQQINFIDCKNNTIEFTTKSKISYKLFGPTESHIEPLDEFIKDMSNIDFIDLLDEIDCAC